MSSAVLSVSMNVRCPTSLRLEEHGRVVATIMAEIETPKFHVCLEHLETFVIVPELYRGSKIDFQVFLPT